MVDTAKPDIRPQNPQFSSGPCAKRPGWSIELLSTANLGRSHRAKAPKAALTAVIERSREILDMPADWKLGIMPGSDTGAFEAAMWSLLGSRGVDVLSFESFSEGWATDAVKQLKLEARVLSAPYGALPDLAAVDPARDLVLAWNGTTSGVKLPNGDFISGRREGLVLCDATSAAYAMALPWHKLDVVTWSWQKALGGEAAHGMLALSPRAVAQLESYKPAWPLPKIFRLTKGGKLIDGIFGGETINTPSMLCVEDALDGLRWAERLGGLPTLIARSEANLALIADWVQASAWAAFLAEDPAARSNTSICLKIVAPWFMSLAADQQAAAAKQIAALLEKEGAALDIGAYRDAPPGLRIWGGATVEKADIENLLPWLDWAEAEVRMQFARTEGGVTYMTARVLISDKLSAAAVEIFRNRGLEVDVKPGLAPAEIRDIIGGYDGLAIRSNTKVTRELLDAAPRLKVVGRAGIGVDNVDLKAATARGVVVMNTPHGNSITTAEHAIAMMFAVARDLAEATASTKAGKWEKNRFMGVELTGKVLGLIGAGNIGGIVADRAQGLRMRVIAYDPYLSEKRAIELGVEKIELNDLLARADFISLHTPLTDATRNILSRDTLACTKKGVRIVNCARGGLIDEAALYELLTSGHIAGAALDVFETEPAKQSPLFTLDNVVCTPHLGASTSEAQENVALQVAEQMSDFLLTGAVTNAINAPSVSGEDAPRLRPYMELVQKLGAFAGS